MSQAYPYLKRRASSAVSIFVLLGCIAITIGLVYTAMQARLIGQKFTSSAYDVEDF